MKLEDVKVGKFLMLLWGPPLSGKTVLASQFPRLRYIDIDDSLASVVTLRSAQKQNFTFQVYDVRNVDPDLEELCGKSVAKVHPWLRLKMLCSRLAQVCEQDDTIVLDNLSRVHEMVIEYIQSVVGRQKLQLQDWGAFVDEIHSLMTLLKSAKANVIIIGHEEVSKDEATGTYLRKLLLATKLSDRLPSMCTESLRLTVRERPGKSIQVVRYLQSVPDSVTSTGSRSQIPDIENPTYEALKPYLEAMLGRQLPEPTWTPRR